MFCQGKGDTGDSCPQLCVPNPGEFGGEFYTGGSRPEVLVCVRVCVCRAGSLLMSCSRMKNANVSILGGFSSTEELKDNRLVQK